MHLNTIPEFGFIFLFNGIGKDAREMRPDFHLQMLVWSIYKSSWLVIVANEKLFLKRK